MIVWTRIARLGDGSAVWSPEAVANLVGQRPEGDLGRGREHVEILDAGIVDGWVLVKLDPSGARSRQGHRGLVWAPAASRVAPSPRAPRGKWGDCGECGEFHGPRKWREPR